MKNWILIATAVVCARGHAGTVYLSDYLGVPAGNAASAVNPPFTINPFFAPSYGIGADCPGSWSSIKIQFIDAGPFEKGLGQHPGNWDGSQVTFDLNAIRSQSGRALRTFAARLGVEYQTSTNNNGGTFTVLLDGVSHASVPTGGRLSPSVLLAVNVSGAHTMTLRTTRAGDFNSNHLCWAIAALTSDSNCPADLNGDGIVEDADFSIFVIAYDVLDCAVEAMPAGCLSDLNGDGLVDDADFSLFAVAYDALLCD